jgi:hypothetical protein
MNDIGWGLLLNLIFWIVVISAIVVIGVWVCVDLFDVRPKAQENIRAGSGRNASPHPSPVSEETEERYRKAA